MSKSKTTAITAILLLLCGGSLHLLHKDNQEATARVEQLQEKINAAAFAEAMQASRGTLAVSSAERRVTRTSPNAGAASPMVVANTAYLNRLNENARFTDLGGALSSAINPKVVNEMDEMDLDRLNQLLIVAQENDANLYLMSLILEKISAKSPADATVLAAEIVTNATTFNVALSSNLGNFFRAWMKADQPAAERWYASVMSSGELIPKSIPRAGLENLMPDRSVMGNRFKALLDAGSEQAISMVGELSDREVAYAMSRLSGDFENANAAPGFISRIVRELAPQQQSDALVGYIDFMAAKDFTTASAWLDAIDIDEWTQASLLSRAARIAYDNDHLTQSEALGIIDGLPDSTELRGARYWIEKE